MEIVYEVTERWPNSGPMQVTVPSIQIDIPVSPETARRRANGYLAMHVALLLGTSDPRLLMGDPLTWKLSVNLHLPSIGYVGQVGTIQINALTGDVIPLSATDIQLYQERAYDLIGHFSPAATTGS